ncbi:MAG: hypothetical protein ACRDGI_04855, partial [Candidatus Limnocylindrales bacterium]
MSDPGRPVSGTPVDTDPDEAAEAAGLAARAAALDAQSLIRGRRQWPLPKQADPSAPLLVVEDLRTYFALGGESVKAVD